MRERQENIKKCQQKLIELGLGPDLDKKQEKKTKMPKEDDVQPRSPCNPLRVCVLICRSVCPQCSQVPTVAIGETTFISDNPNFELLAYDDALFAVRQRVTK